MTTFGDGIYQYGGSPVSGSFLHPPRKVYFVNAQSGLDGNSGRSWDDAFLTIQAAVTKANSPEQYVNDIDIYVGHGTYEETVEFTRAGSGVSATIMQAANGMGTIRLIGRDSVLLRNGTTAVKPALYVGRPNVEIYNFGMIQNTSTQAKTAGTWYSGDLGGGTVISEAGLPAVFVERRYDGTGTGVHNSGYAVNFKIVNCRIRGDLKTDQGAILITAAVAGLVKNCVITTGDNYGLALIANSLGSPVRWLIEDCIFERNVDADILHSNWFDCHVRRCTFGNASVTKILSRTAGGASERSTISDCSIPHPDLAEIIGANNAGIIASGMMIAGTQGNIGDADLTS